LKRIYRISFQYFRICYEEDFCGIYGAVFEKEEVNKGIAVINGKMSRKKETGKNGTDNN